MIKTDIPILSKTHFSLRLLRKLSLKWVALPVVCLLLSVSGVEGKNYQITAAAEGGLFDIGQRFLEEAYRRIGLEVEFVGMPAERALVSSNAGDMDGEIFRVDGIQKEYANLVKVPTSFIVAENIVFTKEMSIHVDGYESLRPYLIGFRRGLKVAEMSMKGFPHVHPVADTKHAFLMLSRDRLDGVIEERMTGWAYVDRLKLAGIRVLEAPVNQVPLFHYLHKKNQDLVPKLDAAFKAMNQEGVLEKIIEQFANQKH